MIALLSSDHIQADFAKLITVIVACSTERTKTGFVTFTVIVAWYTDYIQADVVMLYMLYVISARSTGND